MEAEPFIDADRRCGDLYNETAVGRVIPNFLCPDEPHNDPNTVAGFGSIGGSSELRNVLLSSTGLTQPENDMRPASIDFWIPPRRWLAMALIACFVPLWQAPTKVRGKAGNGTLNPIRPAARLAFGRPSAPGRFARRSNHVLAQTAQNEDAVFNLILRPDVLYADVELSVRLKAVKGIVDQGGGIVWRVKNARTYYVARYNPLEDSFRVYKVVDGKRSQLASIKAPGDTNGIRCASTMKGTR